MLSIMMVRQHLYGQGGEAVEEKVSLSDRFGLWLGFHPCDQDQYLSMIEGYCAAHGVNIDPEVLRAEAVEWQATRGSRSGRKDHLYGIFSVRGYGFLVQRQC